MNTAQIAFIQRSLIEAGYPLPRFGADGSWGDESEHALLTALRDAVAWRASQPAPGETMAWGAKVSPVFRDRVRWICTELDMRPDWLMACMAFETGETFRPDVKNGAGSGATGLIQFMPTTARQMGTSTAELARMTVEDQLRWVYRYFKPFSGRLRSLEDTYMAILLPSFIGKPDDAALFSDGLAYRQNSGLDADKDGKVTKAEAAAKVRAKLERGEAYRA